MFAAGQVQFCLQVGSIFNKKTCNDNEAQNAVVKSLISRAFGSQRNNNILCKYRNIFGHPAQSEEPLFSCFYIYFFLLQILHPLNKMPASTL